MRPTANTTILAVLGLLLAGPPPARADSRNSSRPGSSAPPAPRAERTVLVVASGEGELADTILGAAREASRALDWKAVDAVEAFDPGRLVKCVAETGGACVASTFPKSPADSVLVLAAERQPDDDGQPRVVLRATLVERATGRVVNGDERFCRRCHDLGRLATLTADVVTRLLRNRAVELWPNTWLVVRTVAGARVTIDGSRTGPSEQRFRVAPGPHQVEVTADGYQPATQAVEMAEDQTKVLTVELVPVGALVPAHHDRGRARGRFGRWKWASLGAGGSLLLSGVVLIAVHQPKIEDGHQNETVFESRPYGIAAAAVGGALLVTGGVLFYLDRGERPGSQVAVGLGGNGVFVAGRF